MAAGVIFDLDGTLLRLDVDIEEVRQRLGALFGPHGVTAPFRPILVRIPAAAREAATRGADETAMRRAGFAILDEWEVRAAESARARPGAAAVLEALAGRGVRLGLVTNNGRACLAPALASAGLRGDLFAATVTRDDVPLPKPDPAGIVQVAAALGVDDVWYIGDHQIDVDAGRAARARLPGLRVAGLRGASGVTFSGADQVIDRLEDVPGLVR
jgi:HAD superfamily hydrolase (TIGR01549 family)